METPFCHHQEEKTKSQNMIPQVEVVQTPQTPCIPKTDVQGTCIAVEVLVADPRSGTMSTESLPYEVLDLALDGVFSTEICRATMSLLANARRIIVVAGAGISVAAGIPDFRSSTGLFSTLKADTKFKPSGKELFDASVYKVPTYLLNGSDI